MQEFLYFFGHGFCHQIPLRSFEAGGLIFSVCARDTGIYLGFFFAVVVAFILYARHKEKPAELPPVYYLVVLALFIVPMAVDGLSSYAGLRPTTNMIRYITGFFAGTAAGSLVVPLLFALRADAAPTQKAFSKPSLVVIHLAGTFALGILFFVGYPYLGIIAPVFVVLAFLFIIMSVNAILFTLAKPMPHPHIVRRWLFVLAVSLVFSLIETSLFWLARELLVHTLLNGHDLGEFLR